MDTLVSRSSCDIARTIRISRLVVMVSLFITSIQCQTGLNCTGVTSLDGTCFTLHGPATWSAARMACQTMTGFLAGIVTDDHQAKIQKLMEDEGVGRAWVGGSHTDGQWKWIDDNSRLQPQGCYTDMESVRDLPTEINTLDPAAMTTEGCINACSGYLYAATQGGNKCYCGNTFGRYGTNAECVDQCTGWTESESSRYRWCGGKLMNSVYRRDGSYGNWGYTQPNNHQGNQNCGIVNTATETKMADEECLKHKAYICKITSRSCSVSTPDYLSVGGQCFYFNEAEVPWMTARYDCQSRGGDLVTLKSAMDFSVLKNITTVYPKASQIWIGAHKGAGWQWESGDEFNNPNWATGHPVRPSTCVGIDAGQDYKWVDTACATAMAYICQSDTSGAVITTTIKTTTASKTTKLPSTVSTTEQQTTTETHRKPTTTEPHATLTADPSQATTEPTQGQNTTMALEPVTPTAAKSIGNSELSDLEIGLAVAFSLLGLLLIILLIACVVIYRKNKRKVLVYSYDARPDAPVPNSGSDIDYDSFSSTQNLHKPQR